uniref:Anti-silencing factor n=2 Tax=Parascaris univalens TaxID=6257 RepID=A0A914ZLH1_PARUN
MGSRVNVCSVSVLDNPAKFTDPFKLEITFEVFEPLPDDLDWELVYVGAAESEKYDQVLDSVLVGPVVEGRHKFIFEADGPDPSKIPEDDIVGVTVLLLKCSYREQLFIKVGWFVTVEYTDPEMKENPPITPILDKLQREVCEEDVLVTTFPIRWANASEEVLEGDAEANGSPVKESGDAPELLSRTNGINAEPTVSWEATANMQQDEPMESIKGEQDMEGCNRQDESTINALVGTPLVDVTNDPIPDLVD